MELRAYIEIIRKNLHLIIIFTLVSVTLTLLFTTQQTPVFESVSTYVTRVTPGQGFENTIYAIDTLTGSQRIYETFCDVMESGNRRNEALIRLGLDPGNPEANYGDYTVTCSVLPESNVMLLTVDGTDPALVQQLNWMIGVAGIEYNNTLFGYIELDALDPVWFNPTPIAPNYVFNAVLGVALGIAVSVTIVFLLDYLRSPAERIAESSIYELRLNVYNNRYATRRLEQEIERSKMQNRLLAVALIELHADEEAYLHDSAAGELLLRRAATRIRDKLRPTDILAFRQGSTFTLIMPETPERTALRLVRTIHEHVAAKPVEVEGAIANFTAITGMIENNGGMYDTEHILQLADRALRTARRAGLNTIEFVRTKPSPFVVDGSEVEFHQFNVTDEFQAVRTPADETNIPGSDTKAGDGDSSDDEQEKTQPIFFDPDSNPFGDDAGSFKNAPKPSRRSSSQSVLDRIAQRNRAIAAAEASEVRIVDETAIPDDDEEMTRVGPFAVSSKKSPAKNDPEQVSDDLSSEPAGEQASDESTPEPDSTDDDEE